MMLRAEVQYEERGKKENREQRKSTRHTSPGAKGKSLNAETHNRSDNTNLISF